MHVHTSDSPDADIPAKELTARGVEAGIQAIGFVAHLDLNPDDYCYNAFDAGEYDESVSCAGEESDDRIRIMKGIEVGEPHKYQEQVKKLVDYSDYDFITGSLHSVEGIGMILGDEVYHNADTLEIIEQYYLETLRMVEVSDMDILAHMGLFRRGIALAGLDYSFDETKLWPLTIQRIIRTIIERNIALELNTSGLRRKEDTTYPSREVLEMYRTEGGKLITIGSDTHREPHVFFGLGQGAKLLVETGFREDYTFTNRIPQASGLY